MPVRPFHTRRVALSLGELASYLSATRDSASRLMSGAKVEVLLPERNIDCLEVAESNMKLALKSLNRKLRQFDILDTDVLSVQSLPAQATKTGVTLQLFYWK